MNNITLEVIDIPGFIQFMYNEEAEAKQGKDGQVVFANAFVAQVAEPYVGSIVIDRMVVKLEGELVAITNTIPITFGLLTPEGGLSQVVPAVRGFLRNAIEHKLIAPMEQEVDAGIANIPEFMSKLNIHIKPDAETTKFRVGEYFLTVSPNIEILCYMGEFRCHNTTEPNGAVDLGKAIRITKLDTFA